ncbi:HNH endonuclease [Plantactinospora solaniradicis]|uniref:HNH endonuclease n=1 Tax=Plantactinospora solaniradicis TaxID=1723736 RepID=A0ABW1K0G3_9ACTN
MVDPTPEGLLAEFSEPRPFTLDVVFLAPDAGGVHVVIEDDEVIYVGETGHLRQRLQQHLRGNRGSSVLHKQVGAELDATEGRVATADEIAGWLGGRTVRWHPTDRRLELKAALVRQLSPRFNHLIPGGGGKRVPTQSETLLADEPAMRADPGKQSQFDRLRASAFFPAVVAANRAYLEVAVPDAAETEREYWALSCLPGTRPGRLSAVSMRRMETFVLGEPADPSGAEPAVGFVIVRRSTLTRRWPTPEALGETFPGLTVEDSDYVDAGPDQARIRGRHDELTAALADGDFAAAVRDLAESLLTGRTSHKPGHNYQLADEVLGRPRPTGEWLYPVDEQTDGWGHDRDALEHFQHITSGDIADWPLTSCYQQVSAGDRIWVYASEPHQRLVAAGIAWSDPEERTSDDGTVRRWRLAIHWGAQLTEFLLSTEVTGSDVLDAEVRTVRAMRSSEYARLTELLTEHQAPKPEDLPRGRRRRLAEVTARQGQADFRRRLIEAYGGRCAITGCDVEAVLHAAHISPYDGPATNLVSNGLLLRADLHNLFDRGLLWIDDSYRVRLADNVAHYAEYDGQPLHLPSRLSDRPDPEALRLHRTTLAGIPAAS